MQPALAISSSPTTKVSLVRIGRITGIHGLRGGLRFRPDDAQSELFETLERIFLADGNPGSVDAVNAREYHLLETSDLGHGTIRLMLEDITDANMADTLKGKNVFVEENELPPAGENEFYYRDVIGCEVILTDGRRIGAIEEIIATGANDVFVVRDDDGKEVLVPVIQDVVKTIDVGARQVVIEAIPGLLD